MLSVYWTRLTGHQKRRTILQLFSFQGYYDSSDAGVIDEDGYVSIMARTDDVINVAGHRISTKSLEEVRHVLVSQY